MIPPILQPGVMPTWEEQNDVKAIPVAMTQAALDGDLDVMTALMPEGYLDAVNALGTCVLMLRAVIRSHVGWNPEDGRKVLDVCLEIIKNGRGL
jgi:hypothetical protein